MKDLKIIELADLWYSICEELASCTRGNYDVDTFLARGDGSVFWNAMYQQAAFTREETIKECIEIINQSMEKANIGEDTYVLKLACNASKAEVRDQLEQLFNQPKP